MTTKDTRHGWRTGSPDVYGRLAAVGRTLAETRDELSIYRALREFVAEYVPFDAFLVTSLDADVTTCRCVFCWRGGDEVDPTPFKPLPFGDGVTRQVLLDGEPALCEECSTDVPCEGFPVFSIKGRREAGFARSLLIVPMSSGGRVVGAVHLQSFEPHMYDSADAVPLVAVADHAAAALENVRLLEEAAAARQTAERSREEWERTFDALPDAIVLVDEEDRIRRANRHFWRDYASIGAVPGAKLEDILHPGAGAGASGCEVCFARRTGCEGTFTLPSRLNVTGRDLEITLSRVAGSGTVTGMVQVIRDLTRLRKAEADAAARRAILDSVLSNTADSTALLDLEGRVVWVNPAAERLAGVPASELNGTRAIDYFDPDERPEIEAHFARVLAGESVRFEGTVTLPSTGENRVLEVAWSPIDEGGAVTGVVGTSRDMTERRASLERASEGEKLRALGQLASGVAHDFNNLLAAILGNTQLIGRALGDSNPRIVGRLAAIERAARDGAETVRRIQNFTRVHSEASSETLRVGDLLTQAADLSRPRWKDQAQARGVPIQIAVEEVDPSLAVMGNGAELREVLTNLIINAVDAMPSGGRVTLVGERQGNAALLRVRDAGEGMDEATRRRIFEPFFTTRGPQNSGLGLAVSYGIVRRHGGDIEVESQPGAGSLFTIRLPDVGVSAAPSTRAAPSAVPRLDCRILVVDDDEAVRDVIVDALTEAGAEVLAIGSGEGAVRLVSKSRFDVVVTDLGMPGMNGWDVAMAVRRIQPAARVLLLTGWGENAIPDSPDAAGAVERILAKPINIDDLIEAAGA